MSWVVRWLVLTLSAAVILGWAASAVLGQPRLTMQEALDCMVWVGENVREYDSVAGMSPVEAERQAWNDCERETITQKAGKEGLHSGH